MDTKWTLDKIAFAVKNNIEAGLKGTNNYVFAIDQLRHQVIAKRNAIVKQLEQTGTLSDEDLVQEINCIELDCEDLGLCCSTSTKEKVLHFKIPAVNKILYVGLPNQQKPFKIFEGQGFQYNKYRDARLGVRPYVWMRMNKGELHGFVFNPPTFNFKYISVRAIFEDPYSLNKFGCCSISAEDTRFPAPDYIIDEIIKSLTAEYASAFYRFNGKKPNDQSSTV